MPEARRGKKKLPDSALPRTDLTGRRFGRLTVRAFAGRRPRQHEPHVRDPMWTCDCECGAVHVVRANSLITGLTRSCGCLMRDMLRGRGRGRKEHDRIFRDVATARSFVESMDQGSLKRLTQALAEYQREGATDAKKPAPAEAEAGLVGLGPVSQP